MPRKPAPDLAVPSSPNPVLAITTRSERVESWHRGAIAVHHGDERVLALGDVDRAAWMRSATKPLQALPFLERGLAKRHTLPAEEIALMCASHGGTASHVAAVRSLLQRGGFAETQLGCGAQAPLDGEARLELQRAGLKPAKVHHNCSGKHAGFLHLARECGVAPADYLQPECQSQQEVHAAVAAMAGLPPPIEVGLDGCGAPTFRLPVAALARAFCRLANPDGLLPVRAAACRTILDAAGVAPVYLAGERRLCTALVRTWPGGCLPKNGAEGVYALGLAAGAAGPRWPLGLGIAIKVDDGAERGYQPVMIDVLRHLGVFVDGRVPAALGQFHRVPLHNSQQVLVGHVSCAAEWPA